MTVDGFRTVGQPAALAAVSAAVPAGTDASDVVSRLSILVLTVVCGSGAANVDVKP